MKSCCQNVGTLDRVLRAAAGGVLLTLVFVGPQTPWGWIGALLLASALMGHCCAYRLFKINTTGCCQKSGESCCAPQAADSTTPAPEAKKEGCCGGGCHTDK